jgi:hypothetical protein
VVARLLAFVAVTADAINVPVLKLFTVSAIVARYTYMLLVDTNAVVPGAV